MRKRNPPEEKLDDTVTACIPIVIPLMRPKLKFWLEASVCRLDSYLFSLPQTEEDYIPYPSVHEVHVTPCISNSSVTPWEVWTG